MKNGEYYSSACLYMSKKDFIKKNKLMFMPHILHEDELFTMESLLIAKKTIHFKNEIYIRRIRNNSIMSSDKNLILKINSLLVIIEKMRILKELYFKKSNSFIYNRIRRLSHNILSLICKGNLSDSKEILLKKELILKTTRVRLYFSNPKLYCLMFRKYNKIVIRLRKVLGKS